MSRQAGGARTTARFDSDIEAWLLGEAIVGPGGTAVLALAGAVMLQVDATDTDRTVEVMVEGPVTDLAVGAVSALLGAEAARIVSDPEPTRARPQRDLAIDPATLAQRRRAGRLALLDDLARQAPASPWWAAEAALLCAQADLRLGLDGRADREARAGVDAILGLETRDADQPLPSVSLVTQVGDAIASRVGRDDPALGTRLRGIVGRLGDPIRDQIGPLSDAEVAVRFADLVPIGAISEELLDAVRAPLREERELDPDVVEGAFALGTSLIASKELDPDVVRLPGTGMVTWNRGWKQRSLILASGLQWLFEPAEMLVQVPVEPRVPPEKLGRVWVRVFNRESGDLIAIAPLRPHPGLAEWALARVAIPRHLTVDMMAVGVTQWPTERPDGSYTRAVRGATVEARRAGGAERLRWWPVARQHWEFAASGWEQLGDPDRRTLALGRAVIAARRGGEEQAARELGTTLKGLLESCQWALPLLREDRTPDDPFLAEQFNPSFWLS